MKLYHYRSISSALLEIENGTFHFASKEELNDPLEGFVRVFWQGDKMAWEGLFRHYIYSVARALELYILKADDETLYHGTLVADVHCYKNNFFEKILLKLGEEFITDTDVQNLAGVYGDNCLKVSEKELQYILFYIHNNALIRCLEEFKKNKFVPAEEAEKQIKLLNFSLSVEKLVDAIKKVFSNEKMRVQTIESMEEIFEEMKEFSYIMKGAENDIFLHGKGSEEQIYKEKIEEYITELHKKYKQKTVKRKIASVKAYYSYLEENELIKESPFRKIKVKFKENLILPRIIPREEIEHLLNHMYGCLQQASETVYKYCLRDVAVIELFFATGARVYEISNIRAENVNLNTGLIQLMGKGAKERYVQIGSTSVLNILRKYYAENRAAIKKSGYFFVNGRGNRYTEQSIRLMLKKYTAQAGIERNITPHMFRHSFATYLIEEGVDISCVQRILGHSSIKTTQIYIHVAARKQAEILRDMHPRNNMKIIGAA